MTRIIIHEFWNNLFEEKFTHTLDIARRLHQRGDYNHAIFVTLQKRNVCKDAWYNIMGIFRST
jgi:hypothetical protein